MENPYVPYPVTVSDIRIENDAKDLKTFTLTFDEPRDREKYDFVCGQFGMLSLYGAGECPIGIASSPLDGDFIQFTVKRYDSGVVTSSLHALETGAAMGVRGPYGNGYPMKELEGKDLVIVGGGFAFTTLRSTIRWVLDPSNRSEYGKMTVVYGARSPGELLYKDELAGWEASPDIDMHVTVDKGDDEWTSAGKTEGFVPAVLERAAPSAEGAVLLICGPPIMLKFTIPVCLKLGFGSEQIIESLEMRMSCGIGKCGKCNIGDKYVCKHGPVFTCRELEGMPKEM
ncbi:MAG: FAD/NAD(P)-binding protein [Planctomycetota bacterium]|jgi:NAD(P)H-flavin reductase